MAKKHNKGKKQKPNYSKRGIKNANIDTGTNLELGQDLTDKNCLSNDDSICERIPKKK